MEHIYSGEHLRAFVSLLFPKLFCWWNKFTQVNI